MKEFSLISVSVINLIICIWYCVLTYQKKIKPALAMWVFFTIAVSLSMATYLMKDNFSVWDNILNATDVIMVSIVTVFIYFFGDKSSRFSRFDLICLGAVFVIFLFWIFTRAHLISHLMVQGIMVIAYFPVIKRLWHSKENTESFAAWTLMMINPVLSLISSEGTLATIYSVRAVICTLLLMLLMLRVEYLKKHRAD